MKTYALIAVVLCFITLCAGVQGSDADASVLETVKGYVEPWLPMFGEDTSMTSNRLKKLCCNVREPECDLYGEDERHCKDDGWRRYVPFITVFTQYVPKLSDTGVIGTYIQTYFPGTVVVRETQARYIQYPDNEGFFQDWTAAFLRYKDDRNSRGFLDNSRALLDRYRNTYIVLATTVLLLFLLRMASTSRCTGTNCPGPSASQHPERLARLKAHRSSKRKKKTRSRRAHTERRRDSLSFGHCNPELAKPENSPFGSSDVEDETIVCIIKGPTEAVTETATAGVRTPLSNTAKEETVSSESSQSKKECVKSGDSLCIRVYHIRFDDTLPPEVTDVLLCIDPSCAHDHRRFTWKGHHMLIIPKKRSYVKFGSGRNLFQRNERAVRNALVQPFNSDCYPAEEHPNGARICQAVDDVITKHCPSICPRISTNTSGTTPND